MPEVVTCPHCDKKLRVPDNLVGKKVKCPTCSKPFDAIIGAPAKPAPQKKSPPPDEDEGGTYEVQDKPSRSRRAARDEDEDEDRFEERPRSRRGGPRDEEDDEEDRPRRSRRRYEDDEEDEDDEPRRTRRRRYEDEDEDDEEERRPRRRRISALANWLSIQRGLTLLLTSVIILIVTVIVLFIGGFVVGVAGASRMANQPPPAPGQFPSGATTALGGVICLAVVGQIAVWIAKIMATVGQVFCLPAPEERAAKTLALVTLILWGVHILGNIVSVLLSLVEGGLAAANPMGLPTTGGAVLILSLLGGLAFFASLIVFMFYIRSLALVLRNDSLAKSAMAFVVTIAIAIVVMLVFYAILFLALGMTLGNMGTGGAGGPSPAMRSGLAGVGVLGCVLGCGMLILSLVLLGWYVMILVQARAMVSNYAGGR